jgi:hypothetical protein
MKENRRSPRRVIRYTAWVGRGEGSPLRGCVVSDISATGAKLELQDPEDMPELFNLLLAGRGGHYRRCRVIWRNGRQIGVQFQKIRASALA